MHKIVDVRPLKDYRIWIKFSDGVEGTVDLSELAGQGVFSIWNDINVFNSAFIDHDSHTVAWNGGIDLCPDTLYAKVLNVDPLDVLKTDHAVNY